MSEDHDTTDFEKVVAYCNQHSLPDPVVALGATGGRLDHTMSNLNTILKALPRRIYGVDEHNIVLAAGVGETAVT